ncbi:MAG TPA: polysaccharide deacetylase family protein [Candidatus Rubrimentiphilum sp.]|nr:polysaccharide deacetylase family protein [Candidatus Rubrimentiphilum sp.]
MKHWRAIAIALVCAALAAGAFRLFEHASHLQPALVTPNMDAQQELSPSLAGHVKRLLREQGLYGSRAGRPKLIALTFDDGPYPVFTPLLIDALAKLKIPATFFLIGHDAQQWPELTARIEQNGDEIANHTQTHPYLDLLPDAQVRSEIVDGRRSLDALVKDPAIDEYFRPPHGRYTVAVVKIAQSLGYTTVLWNDDPGDWRASRTTPRELDEHIRRFATAPDIVLLHSGKMASIEMLPSLAAAFRAAGYRFVTLGSLLRAVPFDDVNHPGKHPV